MELEDEGGDHLAQVVREQPLESLITHEIDGFLNHRLRCITHSATGRVPLLHALIRSNNRTLLLHALKRGVDPSHAGGKPATTALHVALSCKGQGSALDGAILPERCEQCMSSHHCRLNGWCSTDVATSTSDPEPASTHTCLRCPPSSHGVRHDGGSQHALWRSVTAFRALLHCLNRPMHSRGCGHASQLSRIPEPSGLQWRLASPPGMPQQADSMPWRSSTDSCVQGSSDSYPSRR